MSDGTDVGTVGVLRYVVDLNSTAAKEQLATIRREVKETAEQGKLDLTTLDEAIARAFASGQTQAVGSLRALRREAAATGDSFGTLGHRMSSSMMTMAGIGAGYGLVRFFSDSVKAANDFDTQMHLMWTNLPKMAPEAFHQIENQASDFARRMHMHGTDVAKALYDITSVDGSPDAAQKALAPGGLLEFAKKASVAGDASMEDSTKAILNIMNAYGPAAENAGKATDELFTAVRDGDVQFKDLATVISNVTPTAAAAGVSFANVGAAIAALTVAGIPASGAVDDLRMMMAELERSGSRANKTFQDATGQTFPQYIAAGHSLRDAAQVIADSAKRNGESVTGLMGRVEAANAVLVLTSKNGAATFEKAFRDEGKSLGATEQAYKTMQDSVSARLQETSAAWDDMQRNIGAAIAPLVMDAAKVAEAFADIMSHKAVADAALIVGGLGLVTFAVNKLGEAYMRNAAAARLAAAAKAADAAAAAGDATATEGDAAAQGAAGAIGKGGALRGLFAKGGSLQGIGALTGGAGGLAGVGMAAGTIGLGGLALLSAGAGFKALNDVNSPDGELLAYGGLLNNSVHTNGGQFSGTGIMDNLGLASKELLNNVSTLDGALGPNHVSHWVDNFSGYTDDMNAGKAAEEKIDTALAKATYTADQTRLDVLTKRYNAGKITDADLATLGDLQHKYEKAAKSGDQLAQSITGQTQAMTTGEQEARKYADQWAHAINVFDAVPKMTTGTNGGTAKDRQAVVDAQRGLQQAQVAQSIAQKRKDAAKNTSQLLSAEQALSNASARIAAEREKVANAEKKVQTAQQSTAVSAATLLANAEAQAKYQSGNATEIGKLAGMGLTKDAISQLLDVEKQHPGTLADLAKHGVTEPWIKAINRQFATIASASTTIGGAMEGILQQAAASASTGATAAGKATGSAYARGVLSGIQETLSAGKVAQLLLMDTKGATTLPPIGAAGAPVRQPGMSSVQWSAIQRAYNADRAMQGL